MRREIDYAGDAVSLNFKIDCLINRKGEIAELFAGSFRATHAAGARAGKEHYGIDSPTGYDIVISNGYAKASEAGIRAPGDERRKARLRVLRNLMDAPEGQATHYVFRSRGEVTEGANMSPPAGDPVRAAPGKKTHRLQSRTRSQRLDVICHRDDARFAKTWEEALVILQEVYPDRPCRHSRRGTMQFMKEG